MKIHFFTIVLNGEPFVEHHLKEFAKLTFDWHWHVIEGVADHQGDTAWGKANGGHIPKVYGEDFLSSDGTKEYLNSIVGHQQVTIYRKSNSFWNHKTEMVNAPIGNIKEPCLLFQVDVDELWTAEALERTRRMFIDDPARHSAYFYCYYFFGPRKYVTSEDSWGTRGVYWMRCWRFQPGCSWKSHEPVCLVNAAGVDVGRIHPFPMEETRSNGITFQHFAYSTEKDVLFKEHYYGYRNATSKWKALQAKKGPIQVKRFLPWIDGWDCIVDDWDEAKNGKLLVDLPPID
jgi:hypothetical protein